MADADAARGTEFTGPAPDTVLTPGPARAASPPPQPASGAPMPQAAPEEGVMSLFEHLSELRTRLVRSLLAVAAGSVVGFALADRIITLLIAPIPGGRVQVLGPGDAFFINVKIAVIVGIILAMPVLLYQAWAFVSPGLTPSERRVVRPWVPIALAFFALGVAIAYFVLPYATGFLLGFTNDRLVNGIAAGPYFDFVTTLFLAFGLVMEFPILLFGLSRVGVVTSQRLAAARRYVLLGITIFATVATPGGDLVSPFVLGATMYLLFEITVVVIRRSGR
jgi:sec-independent protein translocase protein TatC